MEGVNLNIERKLRRHVEFFGLCVALGLGLVGWAMVSAFVGWLASAFGKDARFPVTWVCLGLYTVIAYSVSRRWSESRKLDVPQSVRSKYLETAWSLPLGCTGTIAIGGALLLWGWQIVYWLKAGVWVSLDIVSLLTPLNGEPIGPRVLFIEANKLSGQDWLIAPHDWYGLHHVAHFVFSWISPAPIFFMAGVSWTHKAAEYSHTRSRILASSRMR